MAESAGFPNNSINDLVCIFKIIVADKDELGIRESYSQENIEVRSVMSKLILLPPCHNFPPLYSPFVIPFLSQSNALHVRIFTFQFLVGRRRRQKVKAHGFN